MNAVKVLIDKDFFELIATQSAMVLNRAEDASVEWGEPDEDGCYSPRVMIHYRQPKGDFYASLDSTPSQR